MVVILAVCSVKLNYAGQDEVQQEAEHGDVWGDGKRPWVWKRKGVHSQESSVLTLTFRYSEQMLMLNLRCSIRQTDHMLGLALVKGLLLEAADSR